MTKKRKQLYIIFAIYFITVLSFAVFPPLVALWNVLDSHVLGLPFTQFMIILFAALLIVGLLAWFVIEGRLNVQEKIKREKGEALEY